MGPNQNDLPLLLRSTIRSVLALPDDIESDREDYLVQGNFWVSCRMVRKMLFEKCAFCFMRYRMNAWCSSHAKHFHYFRIVLEKRRSPIFLLRSRFFDVMQRSPKETGKHCVTSKKRLRRRLEPNGPWANIGLTYMIIILDVKSWHHIKPIRLLTILK